MFESLSDRLGTVVGKLRNRGRMSEAEVDEILGEIRTALLEADVNVTVVRNVLARIREKSVGEAVSKALDPAQQVVKIVHAELIALLGGETLKITYSSQPPTVVLMAGLQGSGKTTSAAKLAAWFKKQGRQPMLVGADLNAVPDSDEVRLLTGRRPGVDGVVLSDVWEHVGAGGVFGEMALVDSASRAADAVAETD